MRIVVLTGAGISAESGLPTFRDADGLWEGHRPEEVATPEAFDSDPDLVLRFYDDRRAALRDVEPNVAHTALALLERDFDGQLTIVTQNVDDLHERAGSLEVRHMHGQLRSARCLTCDRTTPWRGTLANRPECPHCAMPSLRPDVVWFGELPHHLDEIDKLLQDCDLFVSIGTSGAVHPAAGFVVRARACGARTLELNLQASEGSDLFDESRRGRATDLVPRWAAEIAPSLTRPQH